MWVCRALETGLESENLDIDPSTMHREIDAGEVLGYSLIDLFYEISGIRKIPGTYTHGYLEK